MYLGIRLPFLVRLTVQPLRVHTRPYRDNAIVMFVIDMAAVASRSAYKGTEASMLGIIYPLLYFGISAAFGKQRYYIRARLRQLSYRARIALRAGTLQDRCGEGAGREEGGHAPEVRRGVRGPAGQQPHREVLRHRGLRGHEEGAQGRDNIADRGEGGFKSLQHKAGKGRPALRASGNRKDHADEGHSKRHTRGILPCQGRQTWYPRFLARPSEGLPTYSQPQGRMRHAYCSSTR